MSDTDATATQQNRARVVAAFDAWASGAGSVFDLLADDATWTITGSSTLAGTYTSKRQFLDEVIAPLSARLAEPIRPTVQSVVAEGDRVVVLFSGHAVATDGEAYDNRYSWHLRFAGDAVIEAVAFFDAPPLDELFRRVPANSA
jgi:ketosteroid isomerase-like protein